MTLISEMHRILEIDAFNAKLDEGLARRRRERKEWRSQAGLKAARTRRGK